MTNETNSPFNFDGTDARPPATPRHIWTLAIVALAMAGFFFLWAAFEQARVTEHETYSEETIGTVTDKWIVYPLLARGTTHHIEVSFDDLQDRHHSYRNAVGEAAWRKYNVGQKVSVWYVPANPANHSLGTKGYPSHHVMYVVFALAMLVFAAWLWFEYLATRPRKRKYRELVPLE